MTENGIYIPEAPSIPGLTFRHMRGEADLPGMLAVVNASAAADHVDAVETLENMTNRYRNLGNCSPEHDIVIVEVDGHVIGYSRVEWRELFAGGRVYVNFGHVHPDWRGRGIGRAMLHHNERRSCEVASGHTVEGPRWHQSYGWESETARVNLLSNEGYEIARNFYQMERHNLDDIPDLPLPAGLEIRPVRDEHLRTIWEAASEAFSDAWGEEKPTDEDFGRFVGSVEYDQDVWKVAWDIESNEVAGFVLGYIKEQENREQNRKLGWTENIATRRRWRKRGLASALIAENLRELKSQGMTEAALGVDTENVTGALRLYESMGFRKTKTEYLFRKPLVLA